MEYSPPVMLIDTLVSMPETTIGSDVAAAASAVPLWGAKVNGAGVVWAAGGGAEPDPPPPPPPQPAIRTHTRPIDNKPEIRALTRYSLANSSSWFLAKSS